MDFWNRKKVRELESRVRELEENREIMMAKLDEAKKKLRGDRVCDGYCDKCAHSIPVEGYYMGGVYTRYSCELDCKCKDFQKKDKEGQ